MNLQQQILGELMLSASGWDDGGYKLNESMFDGIDRRIFRAIARIAADGKRPDVVTVSDWLDTRKMQQDGGEYLTRLVNETHSAAMLPDHVDRLIDRELSTRLNRAAVAIMDSTGSGPERLAEAQRLISEIESRDDGGPTPLDVTNWLDEMQARADGKTGLKTGFCDIDRRLGGLRGGDLVVIAARPSMGKSALALEILLQAGGLMFNLEMSGVSLIDRLVSRLSGVPLPVIRSGNPNDEQWPAVTKATTTIQESGLLLDETPALTIQEIHSRSRQAQRRYGIPLIVIDYLQLVRCKSATRFEEVSEVSRQCKALAKSLNLPVIVLSQLNRKVEERANKRPLMADLRESGQLEQDADAILMLYREEVYDENTPNRGLCEVIAAKIRNGETGTDYLQFDGAIQHFRSTTQRPTAKVEQWGKPYKEAVK